MCPFKIQLISATLSTQGKALEYTVWRLTVRSVAGQVGTRLPEDQFFAELADLEWLEILASRWSCLIRPGRTMFPCLFHQGSRCYLLEEPVVSSAAALLRDVVPAWLLFTISASRTDG